MVDNLSPNPNSATLTAAQRCISLQLPRFELPQCWNSSPSLSTWTCSTLTFNQATILKPKCGNVIGSFSNLRIGVNLPSHVCRWHWCAPSIADWPATEGPVATVDTTVDVNSVLCKETKASLSWWTPTYQITFPTIVQMTWIWSFHKYTWCKFWPCPKSATTTPEATHTWLPHCRWLSTWTATTCTLAEWSLLASSASPVLPITNSSYSSAPKYTSSKVRIWTTSPEW